MKGVRWKEPGLHSPSQGQRHNHGATMAMGPGQPGDESPASDSRRAGTQVRAGVSSGNRDRTAARTWDLAQSQGAAGERLRNGGARVGRPLGKGWVLQSSAPDNSRARVGVKACVPVMRVNVSTCESRASPCARVPMRPCRHDACTSQLSVAPPALPGSMISPCVCTAGATSAWSFEPGLPDPKLELMIPR